MRHRRLFGLVAVATFVMAAPGVALAHDGPPLGVFTQTVIGSNILPFAGPCAGGAGTVSVEFHDMFHITEFADGHVAVSGNQAGTFEFQPFDPNAPSSSGRYREGFSSTFTQSSGTNTSVFSVVGRDENGDQVRFQVRSQFTFANGAVRVDNFTLSCP